MKPIRCLILDMGGVLTEDQREDQVAIMLAALGGPDRESFFRAYWAHRFDYDRGVVGSEGYWSRVAAELGLEAGKLDRRTLVRADLASWFNMRPRMMAFLSGLEGRVGRLVMLSNINADGAAYVRTGEGRAWSRRFDELVLSCELGLLKPELEIYEAALDRAGALPSESLFVDDSADNVEGARRAGLSSFRFEGEDAFEAAMARDYRFVA